MVLNYNSPYVYIDVQEHNCFNSDPYRVIKCVIYHIQYTYAYNIFLLNYLI